MSLRPAQWQFFGVSPARRAIEPDGSRATGNPDRPQLKLLKGTKVPDKRRIERLSPSVRLLALVSMVVVVLFGVVAFHVMLAQGQFALNRLDAKADAEQGQYERLRWQVAQLESPERITSEAINRLGLVPADKVTPVTPGAADMPNGSVDPSGKASTSTTIDSGQWEKVKPHLSSATK